MKWVFRWESEGSLYVISSLFHVTSSTSTVDSVYIYHKDFFCLLLYPSINISTCIIVKVTSFFYFHSRMCSLFLDNLFQLLFCFMLFYLWNNAKQKLAFCFSKQKTVEMKFLIWSELKTVKKHVKFSCSQWISL